MPHKEPLMEAADAATQRIEDFIALTVDEVRAAKLPDNVPADIQAGVIFTRFVVAQPTPLVTDRFRKQAVELIAAIELSRTVYAVPGWEELPDNILADLRDWIGMDRG